MKIAFVLVALFGVLVTGCGGDSGSSCSSACDKIFNECKMTSFSTAGGIAYQSNCVSLCQSGGQAAQQVVNCVEATSCSELSTCE